MYLYLKKKNPKTFLVPCYDMDLIWHSHQVCFSFSIASPYYNGLQSSGISFFENHLWSSSVWSSFDPSEIHPEPVQINSLLSLSYFPTAKTLSGEKPFSHVDPYIWAFSQILPSQVPRPTLGSRGTWLGFIPSKPPFTCFCFWCSGHTIQIKRCYTDVVVPLPKLLVDVLLHVSKIPTFLRNTIWIYIIRSLTYEKYSTTCCLLPRVVFNFSQS